MWMRVEHSIAFVTHTILAMEWLNETRSWASHTKKKRKEKKLYLYIFYNKHRHKNVCENNIQYIL